MVKTTSILHKQSAKNVLDFVNLFKSGNLNLEPGFQRQSVWSERDRAKLIDSIVRNYPLPAIFLYKREDDGRLIYDVIDGKQRLESVLRFMGLMRRKFDAKVQLPGAAKAEWASWNSLNRKKLQHLITGYEIPVVEVDGDIGDIIDVFVRINSTGKALTPQEKRHARFYSSSFLREAARLANRFVGYFLKNDVLSVSQISRMKHVELICELMLSLIQNDVLNKKSALDKVMATNSFDGRQLRRATKLVTAALNGIRKMFPDLKTTRLSQMTDFYSLAVLVGKFQQEGLILNDRRRNRLAWDLLLAFTSNVDEVRELQRIAKGAKPGQEVFRDYLLTVSQMTDDVNQRRKREQILRGIIGSLFEKKDGHRGFSGEQRRIMWNTAAERKCAYEGCGKKLSWDDFTLDHIHPHSKGGQSKLKNAALMCRKHNSKKGNRKSM